MCENGMNNCPICNNDYNNLGIGFCSYETYLLYLRWRKEKDLKLFKEREKKKEQKAELHKILHEDDGDDWAVWMDHYPGDSDMTNKGVKCLNSTKLQGLVVVNISFQIISVVRNCSNLWRKKESIKVQ